MIQLDPADLGRWIERILPHLAKMAEGSGGRFMPADIATAILRSEMQGWIIMEGALIVCLFVTEFVTYPRLRALRFVGCVGKNWQDWVHFREDVESWGRGHGCTMAEAMVPHVKWRHVFDDYRVDHIRMEKAL